MSQISLRGIDPDVERRIRRIAAKSGKSLNRVVLEILYEHPAFKPKGGKPAADSLRELAGGWSEEDAEEFEASIRTCEQVDEEAWQ
jgi:hypothetical protein